MLTPGIICLRAVVIVLPNPKAVHVQIIGPAISKTLRQTEQGRKLLAVRDAGGVAERVDQRSLRIRAAPRRDSRLDNEVKRDRVAAVGGRGRRACSNASVDRPASNARLAASRAETP